MSFSSEIKKELCNKEFTKKCCIQSELSALIRTIGTIQMYGGGKFGMKMNTENAAVARRIFNLIKELYGVTIQIQVMKKNNLDKKNIYTLILDNSIQSLRILKDSGVLTDNNGVIGIGAKISPEHIKTTCCKRSYTKGVFLGCGSISNPEKNYHVELVINNEGYAKQIRKVLSPFKLNMKLALRKDSFILYIKEAEKAVDFLNIIGAHNALLKYENIIVYKELKNDINRKANFETANYQKTFDAAARQVKNIEYISKTIGLDALPESLIEIAQLRLENHDASLIELGTWCRDPLGKSGVNHRLRRLEKIAMDLREKRKEMEVDYE